MGIREVAWLEARRQRRLQVADATVLEHRAGDCEREDAGPDLADVDEGHRVGEVGWRHQRGGDAVCGGLAGAGAEGDEDGETVDGADGGGGVDQGVHEGAADGEEQSRDGVPGHVVAQLRHREAIECDGEDGDANEGEQAHCRNDAVVAVRKLEEQGNIVYWDKQPRAGAGGSNIQENEATIMQEITWEEATLGRCKERKVLLDNE